MADEKPNANEEVVPLNDEQAQTLAARLDDKSNPLTTEELDSLDDYYVAQDQVPSNESTEENVNPEGGEPEQKPAEGGTPASGADPLEAAIAAKNKANQYAGQQSHELGKTRKELETAQQRLSEFEAAKSVTKPKDDGAGAEVDMNDPEQLAKFTDARIQKAMDVKDAAQQTVNAQTAESEKNYQRGKANLESLQTSYKGVFDTSEPITSVMDKISKGQHVNPEDAKIAEKVTFINQWGRDRNIFNLKVAYREFNLEQGVKDPLTQNAEERGRNDLANEINERENQHANLTDVANTQGKKVMTISDLDREVDQRKVLDNMTVEEVRALEEQINADPNMSLTG